MQDIITLLSSFGFPVVACFGLAYFFKYFYDKNREDLNALRDVLNSNTLVIQQLVDFLKQEGEKDE